MKPRIGLLGSKGTTLDFLAGFEAETGFAITHLVTLDAETKASAKVAYYQADALLESARGLTTHQARSYTLTDPRDLEFFRAAELDVLFVIGWERLLPLEVLNLVRAGAYGMHGSPYGLPLGRGRSPMNWAILHGHKIFATSLFRYSTGIDDGDILGTLVFTISDRDDIATLHLKNRLCMLKLAGRHLGAILAGTAIFTPQPDGEPSFYPRRAPEDGAINWSRSTVDVDRLIRAVAPPYPGAFTFLDGEKITIRTAQPFEPSLFASAIAPGTIVDVVPSMRGAVVKTGDGTLLVKDYDGPEIRPEKRGRVLESVDTVWSRELLAERYHPSQPERQWEVKPAR